MKRRKRPAIFCDRTCGTRHQPMTMYGEPSNREIMDALLDFRDGVGEHFVRVDERFIGIDERFKGIDRRFDDLEHRLNKRFDSVDLRFDTLERRLSNLERPRRA